MCVLKLSRSCPILKSSISYSTKLSSPRSSGNLGQKGRSLWRHVTHIIWSEISNVPVARTELNCSSPSYDQQIIDKTFIELRYEISNDCPKHSYAMVLEFGVTSHGRDSNVCICSLHSSSHHGILKPWIPYATWLIHYGLISWEERFCLLCNMKPLGSKHNI